MAPSGFSCAIIGIGLLSGWIFCYLNWVQQEMKVEGNFILFNLIFFFFKYIKSVQVRVSPPPRSV